MLEQCRIVRGDRRRFAIRLFYFKAIAVAAMLSASPVYSAAPATSAATEIAFTPAPTGAGPLERIDPTYQWSIAMPSPEFERRAYLWVPPQCKRVRAVVVGLQNMLEKLMFQNADFRQECAAADVAILYIAPGSVPQNTAKEPALVLGFKDAQAATRELDAALAELAGISGYAEIAKAPLIPVGHSAATPFVWGYAWVNPARCVAVLPYKGWFSAATGGVPYLHVASEWAEVGGPNWGTTWLKKDRGGVLNVRGQRENPEIGEYAELGNGHFAWQPDSGKILGEFIKKCVAARVPDSAADDGSTILKPLPIESGVLVDPTTLGTAEFKAYPYPEYRGDPKKAYWYIDADLAQTISRTMQAKLSKKPQAIDFLVDAKPAPLDQKGFAEVGVKLLEDGVSWKVQACFLDRAPPNLGYGDQPLGHSSGEVYFRAGSGALKQTGPDTFRVWLGRGGIERQGNPWDPWVIATSPGDATYRSADRPIHFWVPIKRKDGKPQSIHFPKVPDLKAGAEPVTLHATADSGLPVQYFIDSGPAEVDEKGTLTLQPIPPRAKYPVTVRVGAYQWGRGLDPKIASAEPVYQEILLQQ